MIIDVEQFLTLREQLPVVDVRSENEYADGHMPSAVNIPLLNNEERAIVGTIYKNRGQREAIKAGFKLVGPRLLDIIDAAEQVGNEFIVHCWRGGMRSANFCQFVGMAGKKTHQLQGGYKAYRNYALASLKASFKLIVVSGYTGSGKSDILRTLRAMGEQVVDLEGLANHKGSAFGGLGMPSQPTTEQFQNDLFETIRPFDLSKPIWVEDESIAIGKIFLPGDFWKTLRSSPVVVLDVPKDVRIERLVKEYGSVDVESFHGSLKGIAKRLGGQHYNTAVERLYAGDMPSTIDVILNYYDKAYGRAIDVKKDRIVTSVNWDGVSLDDVASRLINETKPRVKA